MTTLKKVIRHLLDIGLFIIIAKLAVYITLAIFCILQIPLSCFNRFDVTIEDLGFLLDFCVLFIGILLGIATIIATSSVPIAYEYAKRGKASTFISIIFISIFECFLAIVNIIFPICAFNISIYATIACVINASGSFLYFLLYIAMVCKYNIEATFEKDTQEKKKEDTFFADLDQIKKDLMRIRNNNKKQGD